MAFLLEELKKRVARKYPSYLKTLLAHFRNETDIAYEKKPASEAEAEAATAAEVEMVTFPYTLPLPPLQIRLNRMGYEEARETIDEIFQLAKNKRGKGPVFTVKKIKSRQWGTHNVPHQAVFETEGDFLYFLGKGKEGLHLKTLLESTQTTFPEFLSRIPGKTLLKLLTTKADIWSELVKVCQYFFQNPRPDLFIRELPLDLSSKFLESHQGLLRELLPFFLSPLDFNPEGKTFEQMFNLKKSPHFFRMRFLDLNLKGEMGIPFEDFAASPGDLSEMAFPSQTKAIITENLYNYLGLPPLPRTLGIFGGGRSVSLLTEVAWSHECDLYYWGDLDAQGFEILSHLRQSFPKMKSLFMDLVTLNKFGHLKTTGVKSGLKDLNGLGVEEKRVYDYLVKNNVRLEQEKIPWSYCLPVLSLL